MTAKELKNIIPLRNEIKQLQADIRAAVPTHDVVTGSNPEHPYITSHHAVTGYTDDVLRDKTRLDSCKADYDRLIAYIDGVKDSLIRQILREKYCKGYSWQKIALLHQRIDEGTPRKKIKKFFKNSENSEFPNV